MTHHESERWLTGDADTDELLARVLSSSALDEPPTAQVEALVACVSAAAAATISQAPGVAFETAQAATATAAKSVLIPKLAALIVAGALAGGAVWIMSSSAGPRVGPRVAPAVTTFGSTDSKSDGAPPATPSPAVAAPTDAANDAIAPAPKAPITRHRTRAARASEAPAAAPGAIAEVPQLERELHLLGAMRNALASDPCATLRLGAQHRADFRVPVLSPERDQLIEAARSLLASADAGACAP